VAAYEEAIVDLRRRGDVHGLGSALGRLATVRRTQGDTRGANVILTEAVELLEREPPSPELCSAYESMASDRVISGHTAEALGWADKALALADELGGLPELRPRVLDVRGRARIDVGDFGGMDDLRAALALGLELGSGYDTAMTYNNLAEPVWLVEGPAAALAVCAEGVDFAERRGLAQAAMWLRSSTLGPLLDLGRWDEALALAEEAIAWDLAHGGDYLAVGCQHHTTLIRLWRGELGAAGVLAAEALPKAREIDDLQQLVPALVNAALVAQADGDRETALALAEETVRLTAERAGGHRYRGQYLADLVRLTAEAAPALARDLVEQARPTATRYRLAALTARAVLAETEGDAGRAAGLFAEAAGGWLAYGQLLEWGRALLGAGRCRTHLGDPAGRPALHDAHAVFIRLGAHPLAAEAAALLDRLP
jgi:tetratricopeptide (TPR) repeat protein